LSDTLSSSAWLAPKFAILADHSGFDCAAADEFNDAGDNPGVRKINTLNALMRFGQHLLGMRIDHRKVRSDPVEDSRFK
jgi:hypothetical protein